MAFATVDDVQTRLARTLSADEQDAATLLLDGVAAEIALAVGLDLADITDPGVLRFISIEAVCRVMANPSGARSTSESLGAYQYAVSFFESQAGLLNEREERQIREAVWGSTAAGVRTESVIDDVIELAETGEIDPATT